MSLVRNIPASVLFASRNRYPSPACYKGHGRYSQVTGVIIKGYTIHARKCYFRASSKLRPATREFNIFQFHAATFNSSCYIFPGITRAYLHKRKNNTGYYKTAPLKQRWFTLLKIFSKFRDCLVSNYYEYYANRRNYWKRFSEPRGSFDESDFSFYVKVRSGKNCHWSYRF